MVITAHTDIHNVEFVGGRLCLDFVNTANWEGDSVCDERLVDAAAIETWAHRQGLIAKGGSVTADTAQFRALRASVRRIMAAHAGLGPAASLTDIEAFEAARELAPGRLDFTSRPPVFPGSEVDEAILRAVADSTAETVLTVPPTRLKICPGPRCAWVFVDASPSGRRRWCSMATCGNRAKSRRHHAKGNA